MKFRYSRFRKILVEVVVGRGKKSEIVCIICVKMVKTPFKTVEPIVSIERPKYVLAKRNGNLELLISCWKNRVSCTRTAIHCPENNKESK